IIRWLDIKPEEQRHLQTIIDANEKRRRKRERDRERTEGWRRGQGARTREEYLEEQRERTEDKLWQLQKAIERHPDATNKRLAAMLQISVRRVQQLKKLIKN
ncbi:replication protein, partial [Geobacillus thermoleovorans]